MLSNNVNIDFSADTHVALAKAGSYGQEEIDARVAELLSGLGVAGNLLAAVVGLIPNCASSVVITELYLSGMLTVGAMFSGLLVNAGIGTALLIRTNRPLRDSLRLILILLGIGAAFGILVDLTPLASLF